MTEKAREDVIRVLKHIDETGDFAILFKVVGEDSVWAYSSSILADSQIGPEYGPVLIKSISRCLDPKSDRASAAQCLILALEQIEQPFVFREAQAAVLRHADLWSVQEAKSLSDGFRSAYQGVLSEPSKQFVATSALEGCVLLALSRSDHRLLHTAISVLLDWPPPIPSDVGDAAHLMVKALKLMGRIYATERHELIPGLIEERASSANYAVKAEACYNMGVVCLFDAVKADDETELMERLKRVVAWCKESSDLEAERSDASLLQSIAQCYLTIKLDGSPEKLRTEIGQAQTVLIERLRYNWRSDALFQAAIEVNLVHMLSLGYQWLDELAKGAKSRHLFAPLASLAQIYTTLTAHMMAGSLDNAFSQTLVDQILLPATVSTFIRTEELRLRVSRRLSDKNWLAVTSPDEVKFLTLLNEYAKAGASPKDGAAISIAAWRMAAEAAGRSELVDLINEMEAKGEQPEKISTAVFHYMSRQLDEIERAHVPTGTARMIYQKIVCELEQRLGAERDVTKLVAVRETLGYLCNYYMQIYNSDLSEERAFLFSNKVSKDRKDKPRTVGLGSAAKEGHLQDDCYRFLLPLLGPDRIRKEPRDRSPGRPDLWITVNEWEFPIEVKLADDFTEYARIKDLVRQSYLSQAHTYSAASNTCTGFLFVLDTTEKPLSHVAIPPAGYCYVDERVLPPGTEPVQVVVMIFPANRRNPSDPSWKSD